MVVPKSLEDAQAEEDSGRETGRVEATEVAAAGQKKYKTVMKSIIKLSLFEREMKVKVELNRVNRGIIKLLDSIKMYEPEDRI